MSHRVPVSVSAVAVLVALVSSGAAPAAAQTTIPRTAWGQPDLQGIWDFRTITPLERPEDLAEQEFWTEEEAASLEQDAVDLNTRLLNRPAQRTEVTDSVDRGTDGAPGFYNNFWLDTGTHAETLEYEFTVTDPDVWTRPWTASIPMRRTDAPLYEYACHEGNHSLPNMLAGQRAAEKVATARP